MDIHDIYNILLHILFLFGILTGLFWVIISKDMDKETISPLHKGVTATVDNLFKSMQSNNEPYPLICNYMKEHEADIKKYIAGQLHSIESSKVNTMNTYNNKLKKLNYIILGCIFILTVAAGIWLEIHNKKFPRNPVNAYYNWWRILLINVGLFIGVGICEATFFLFIASKYTPINATDAQDSVIKQLIASFNQTGSGTQ